MVTRRARFVGMALGAAGALVACANILGIEDLQNGTPPPIEAGPDVPAIDPCTTPPGPRKPTTADGTTQGPILLALDSIDFGDSFDPPGVNLDLRCTYAEDAGSCVPLAGKVPTGQIDGDGGVDNSSVNVLANKAFPLTVAGRVVDAVKNHIWTLLFRLDDYSGAADDPSVTLRVVTGASVDVDGGPDAGSWAVDGLLADAGMQSAPQSTVAWVAGGVLRAEFGDLQFVARSNGLGTFLMRLRSAYVIGSLDVAKKTLKGTIAGRWSAADATLEISRLKVGPTCVSSIITDSLCRTQDIKTNPKDDNKGFECDALSVAFRFTAADNAFGQASVDGGDLTPAQCATSPCN